MSLLKQKNPFVTFTDCASRFLAAPEITTGIDLDDAVVALKRHARVVLNDEPLAMQLEQFTRPIRDRDLETLRSLFEAIIASHGHLSD